MYRQVSQESFNFHFSNGVLPVVVIRHIYFLCPLHQSGMSNNGGSQQSAGEATAAPAASTVAAEESNGPSLPLEVKPQRPPPLTPRERASRRIEHLVKSSFTLPAKLQQPPAGIDQCGFPLTDGKLGALPANLHKFPEKQVQAARAHRDGTERNGDSSRRGHGFRTGSSSAINAAEFSNTYPHLRPSTADRRHLHRHHPAKPASAFLKAFTMSERRLDELTASLPTRPNTARPSSSATPQGNIYATSYSARRGGSPPAASPPTQESSATKTAVEVVGQHPEFGSSSARKTPMRPSTARTGLSSAAAVISRGDAADVSSLVVVPSTVYQSPTQSSLGSFVAKPKPSASSAGDVKPISSVGATKRRKKVKKSLLAKPAGDGEHEWDAVQCGLVERHTVFRHLTVPHISPSRQRQSPSATAAVSLLAVSQDD